MNCKCWRWTRLTFFFFALASDEITGKKETIKMVITGWFVVLEIFQLFYSCLNGEQEMEQARSASLSHHFKYVFLIWKMHKHVSNFVKKKCFVIAW